MAPRAEQAPVIKVIRKEQSLSQHTQSEARTITLLLRLKAEAKVRSQISELEEQKHLKQGAQCTSQGSS